MASEDVIELGSSDDEAEPATKKMKPMPNAMVHIPGKIHGVTIKPAKMVRPSPYPNNISAIPKVLAGKNVTVTKIVKNNVVSNPYAAKIKTNGKNLKIPNAIIQQPKPVFHNKPSVNPLNIIKNINSQLVINKISPDRRVFKNPIKIHSPRTLNRLPPSITVTRTSGAIKRTGPIHVTNPICKKQKVNSIPKTVVGEVLTVELDDDDLSSTSNVSPQWYVRPEEQMLAEEANNKEPEKPLYVEITIEDSPVKPPPNKRTCEVGAELSITIDDSPVKTVTAKGKDGSSDEEDKSDDKDKHSKKKLEYPEETPPKTIEIEITPQVEGVISQNETKEKDIVHNIFEIEESPIKIETHHSGESTPKKDNSKPRLEVNVPLLELQEDDDNLREFHPVYRNFIKLCFELENSEDMKKIVEKKIKTYYKQVPKDYTESEEFVDMVSSKIVAMKAGPEKMYLYIKDIVDELNLQRKLAKSQIINNIETKASASDKFLYGEDSEYDTKRQRQIRKLEKTLKKLHRAIQKLEEQEVDFDDDEDSVYLLTESDEDCTSNKNRDIQPVKDRTVLLQRYFGTVASAMITEQRRVAWYKERMVRVHAKFCQLTNTKMPSEPRVQIDARLGQPQGPAKKLEKWINKKVPIGTPLPFPDFHDVLRCVREANEEDKLGWNDADIMEEARDLFTRCGKKLQRRRQENEWRLAASRITVEVDPAEKSDDLKRKLEENKKMATKKETEVFNKYADRQNQLKLEAEEIGDKEAEESPIESDDDEPVDESPLQNTEKRKERLKRLLQEKSKKTTEEKSPNHNNGSENFQSIDIADKNEDVISENQSEDNATNDCIAANESKEILQSVEQENNNEANKENQLNITDEANKEDKTDDINKASNISGVDKTINREFIDKTKIIDNGEKIHSLSDDSNKLESDVDELHLLQKLHSGNELCSSTSDLSGCDTPIAISDTLGSSEDSKKQANGVISIENSSFSESEVNKDAMEVCDKPETNASEKVDEDLIHTDTEVECSSSGVEKKIVKTNNDEYNESIEDILLASSDDETEEKKDSKPFNEEEAVNLKDDDISIGDTLIEGTETGDDKNKFQQQDDSSSVESVTLVLPNEGLNKVRKDTSHERVEDNINNDHLHMGEDTSSIESVTLVLPNEGLNKVCKDTSIERVEDNTKNAHLHMGEDTSSVESVTLVSVDSVLMEENKKTENKVTEIECQQKQDDVGSVESLDVSLDSNNKLSKVPETIVENTELCTNISKNNVVEVSTVELRSHENMEEPTNVIREPTNSVDLLSAKNKEINDIDNTHD